MQYVALLSNFDALYAPLCRRATSPVRQAGQQHTASGTSVAHATASSSSGSSTTAAAAHASGSSAAVVVVAVPQSQQSQSQQRMQELQRLPVSHRPVRWAAMQSAAARRNEARERSAMQYEETAQRHITKYSEVRSNIMYIYLA
jgi:acyl-CoA synthetase (NDP forming)